MRSQSYLFSPSLCAAASDCRHGHRRHLRRCRGCRHPRRRRTCRGCHHPRPSRRSHGSRHDGQRRRCGTNLRSGCRLAALLDTAAHGLRTLSNVRLKHPPRMADFAYWATACETAFCSGGGFLHAYRANRRTAIEDVVEADPVAARIRELMAKRTLWVGSASTHGHALAGALGQDVRASSRRGIRPPSYAAAAAF